MASEQSPREAAARESRANARETMAVLTSGARQKVDTSLAGAAALGQQMLHPLDKNVRVQAQEVAADKKQQAIEKRDALRSVARQQATQERLAAKGDTPEVTGGEDCLSAQTAVQQGIHAPVEELDRADPPTSEKQRATLGELLGFEVPEENPHIQHVEGNDVYNPHLDRNMEFRDEKNADPGEAIKENVSPEEASRRNISSEEEERSSCEGESGAPAQPSDTNFSPEGGRNILDAEEGRPSSGRDAE